MESINYVLLWNVLYFIILHYISTMMEFKSVVSELPRVLPLVQPFISHNCSHYLQGMMNRIFGGKTLTQADYAFVYYSGHITNEAGLVESCKNTPNMNFFNIQMGIEVLRNFVGICLSDQCSVEDWNNVYTEFSTEFYQALQDPANPYYLAQNYFVVQFNQVHPFPVSRPLGDSYTFIFTVSIIVTLILVLYATLKYSVFTTIKRCLPFCSPSGTQIDTDGTDPFTLQDREIQKTDTLRLWDYGYSETSMELMPTTGTGQAAVDLVRVFYSMFAFMFALPFTAALVSKIPCDVQTNKLYHTNHKSATIQATLFYTDGFVCMSGYICAYSCLRVSTRLKLEASLGVGLTLAWKYFLLVVKRWYRLAIGMVLGMIYVWKILPLISVGPLQVTSFGCNDTNYFTSLFFINNNFGGNGKPEERMCVPWYWYLGVDFWLFTTLPGIVLIGLYSHRMALFFCTLLGLSSMAWSMYYQQSNHIREIHGNNGFWIVDVLTKPYFHGLPYYIGVSVCFMERMFYGSVYKDSTLPVSPPNISALFNALGEKRRWRIHRLLEGIAITSLILFIANYLIYYYGFQNDNIDISKWPQWRHTLWNTVGVLLYGMCPLIFAFSLFYRWGHVLIPLLAQPSPIYGTLKNIYYDILIWGIPLVLTMLGGLTTVQFFDTYLNDGSVLWMSALVFLCCHFIHAGYTRPCVQTFKKITNI